MVSINYATREISCKIVYYGPGLSGKTTNLQYVHAKVPADTKGKLISLATDADRTLYFDFLPINIGTINGFATKFQLYTVPGQVYYNATRKLVLRGVDGLVYVADSQPDKMDENIESLNNLKENLLEYGYKLDELPVVIQYNKQDLPGVMTPEKMRSTLNANGWPEFTASAKEGFGVFDTLKCILKLVLEKARAGSVATPSESVTAQPVAVAVSVPAMAAPRAAEPPAPSEPIWQAHPARPQWEDQPLATETPLAAKATSDPVMRQPVTSSQENAVPREDAVGNPEPSAVAYRPFPGNRDEDEERNLRGHHPIGLHGSGKIRISPPAARPAFSETAAIDHERSEKFPIDSPRMAPSLKKEKTKTTKKRPFWKRLFGLN